MQCTYNGLTTFFTYEKDREKKLFACGSNSYGQLGLGYMSEQVTVPEEVKLGSQFPYCLLTDVATVHAQATVVNDALKVKIAVQTKELKRQQLV